MPRPPKKENKGNPLRKLRDALGENGIPITQQKLAEYLELSPETIKSIEAGRRQRTGLSADILQRAYTNLGAEWSVEHQAWFSAGAGQTFDRDKSAKWRKSLFRRDAETHAMALRVLMILEHAPNEEFIEVVDTIEAKLQEVLRAFDFRPDRRDVDWFNTQVYLVPENRNEYVRRRPIWAARKGELFDFRYRRGFVTPRNRHGIEKKP